MHPVLLLLLTKTKKKIKHLSNKSVDASDFRSTKEVILSGLKNINDEHYLHKTAEKEVEQVSMGFKVLIPHMDYVLNNNNVWDLRLFCLGKLGAQIFDA